MINFQKQKRNIEGTCNICGNFGRLTWDHVPPAICGNFQNLEIEEFLTAVSKEPSKKVFSQNGLKFRSICATCNNELLGAKYDKALGAFYRNIVTLCNSNLILPKSIILTCHTIYILKSIYGHLVAAKIDIGDSSFDELVKPTILDPDSPIPNSLQCYYWLYPYQETVVIRDFAITIDGKVSFCQLFAFFPMAFLITETTQAFGLPSLSTYVCKEQDKEAKVPVSLSNIKPYGWPWHPDFSGVLFGGAALQSSKITRPR